MTNAEKFSITGAFKSGAGKLKSKLSFADFEFTPRSVVVHVSLADAAENVCVLTNLFTRHEMMSDSSG
jgi:hypothetical protein